jgi:hypothetical protein
MEQVGQAAAAKATEVGAVAGRDEAANIDLVEFLDCFFFFFEKIYFYEGPYSTQFNFIVT